MLYKCIVCSKWHISFKGYGLPKSALDEAKQKIHEYSSGNKSNDVTFIKRLLPKKTLWKVKTFAGEFDIILVKDKGARPVYRMDTSVLVLNDGSIFLDET